MMVAKTEQERIKALLRETITLLCRNGLTFKSQFSVEALIGITLDEDDVFLVSINESIKPTLHCYNDSSDESSREMDEKRSSRDRCSPNRSSNRNRKRRRPHRSVIKAEPNGSEKEDDTHIFANSLLDLSVTACQTNKMPKVEADNVSGDKKPSDEEHSQNSVREINSVDVSDDQRSEEEEKSHSAVIVKKEYLDESWPPAGVLQEVTVGSDTNPETSYPNYSSQSTMASSSGLQHLTSTMATLSSSSSRTHPAIAGMQMMNGIPFPPLPLPQSHFAQALGRLVGSMPPSLSHSMPVNRDVTMNKSPSRNSGPGSIIYQPTSRSSLPKEAVALMTEWLRKNQHNPYPTDDVKDEFVRVTNLTYNQINYWFTNARRRLLPKWELQRKIEAQQLAERLSQGNQQVKNELQTWMSPDAEESNYKS
ncbi:hypothetical protein LSH36_104g05061 [Paralvinella palmiformis]|uniref:Homeobox domain-containing protein n=1 Tax=Paralvinella palmiformis TaxID=53620 RepID=A0AAD9K106_9ANNE|nr:hypothetical protein LSH36_104g05061 [Paralvinella palmiformis]